MNGFLIIHHIKFLSHQLAYPLFEFKFIKNFLVSSQIRSVIEKVNPGIPNRKKGNGLYNKKDTFRRILN
jgi:hypothetical protein